jgi:hypothetical protein
MVCVDPIGEEDLAGGQEAQDQIAQENGKMAGERSNNEDFRQIRPIRPGEPCHRAERHL